MAPLSQTRAVLTLSEACERNKGPILAVLREELAGTTRVLEVGSGTGQHAVHFAAGLPQLVWQPSELAAALAPLAERIRLEGGANLRAPLALDVRDDPWPLAAVDVVFSANTLHIMAWSAVREFFRGVGGVRDPESGVRDFEALDAEAQARGLRLTANREMPANNRTLVWRHAATAGSPRNLAS
jgi:SAM-dependent methyltransferase